MQHPGTRYGGGTRGASTRCVPRVVAPLAVFSFGLLACSVDGRSASVATGTAEANPSTAGGGASGATNPGTAGANVGGGASGKGGSGGADTAGSGGSGGGSAGANGGVGGSLPLADAGESGAALGAGCTRNEDCAGGHCVPAGEGGALLCCDAACGGLCEACDQQGLCQAAADDAACASVPCASLGVGCRSATDIGDGLCRGRGECKDTTDCVFEDLPDGTACSVQVSTFNVCQGGTCLEPPVLCGQETCGVNVDDTCCFRGEELGASAGYACEPRSVCGNSGIFQPVQFLDCDSPDDCRPGSVCCIDISVNARFANLRCLPAEECNVDDTAQGQMRFAQLCGSLSFSDPGACPAGRPCVGTGDDSIMPGFSFCGPP